MYGDSNFVHDIERDEERSARRGLNEMQRAVACRHGLVRRSVCLDCGEVFE